MAHETLAISANFGMSLLAQAERPSSRGSGVPTDLLLWIGVLIVVVVAGGLILVQVHKRMLKPPSAGPDVAGIMEELRRMRDTGAMTEEEYEATRRNMARKLAGSVSSGSPSALTTSKRAPAHLGTAAPGFDHAGNGPGVLRGESHGRDDRGGSSGGGGGDGEGDGDGGGGA